jgi:hypothetical protein
MRGRTIILALALASSSNMCGLAKTSVTGRITSHLTADKPATSTTSSEQAKSTVDFTTQVKPMLEGRCKPCHFAGGALYQRLPFDRPETIKKLGTKLFTRIRDEKERQLLRDFLAQEQKAESK